MEQGELYQNQNGFERVVVFEQPMEVREQGRVVDKYQMLFAEAHKGTLAPQKATVEQGWRIYFQKKDTSKQVNRSQYIDALLTSNHWFSLQAKGPNVGVYFPEEIAKDKRSMMELMQAVDAYARSTGVLIVVPQELLRKEGYVRVYPVENPYSGRKECYRDLAVLGNSYGTAHINGVTMNRG